MGSGGGGTSQSIQDVPPQFKPAFTNLFNSAFGAARTAAGQPGFGTAGQPTGATQIANMITGLGTNQANPFAPPGNPFSNPFANAFPSPANSQLGYINTPQGSSQGAKAAPQQSAQQFGFPNQPATPQQFSQAPGEIQRTTDVANTAPGSSIPTGAKASPTQNDQVGAIKANPEGFNQIGRTAGQINPKDYYPNNPNAGTTGIGSTKIPLAAGPAIIGPAFPEQFTAGTSPLEFESLAQREAIARQLQGIGNPLLNLGYQTARGDFLRPESNPFLVGNINASLRPITQDFTNSVLPNFNSQAINSGAFSGSSARDLAFNQLASGYGQQLLDTGTQIAFDNYLRERQLQQGAGQLLDQGSLLNQLTPELLAQVGLGQRELAQRPLDEALLQFQEQINAPFRPLFPLASIIQGSDIGSTFSTTVPTPSPLSSGIVGALGGASAGAGIADTFDLSGGNAGLATALGGLLGGLGGGLG